MEGFSTIEEVLGDLRRGKIVLVTDNESGENEGDLICAAQYTIMENMNSMAVHDRGLVRMPMSTRLCIRLKLSQMVFDSSDSHETAFTISIDHISTSTSISAAGRGVTARQRANALSRLEDFCHPGHMFPLAARKSGVLERNDHTEATVGLVRLAGFSECGLHCGVMKKDRTMMWVPQLLQYVGQWSMRITTIKTLRSHHKQYGTLVGCAIATHMPTRYGTFRAYGYRSLLNGEHHAALIKGEIGDNHDLLCRVHSECLIDDAFGSLHCDREQQFTAVMARIEQEDKGILLCMCQKGRGIKLLNRLRAYELQGQGMDTLEVSLTLGFPGDLEGCFIDAQILRSPDARTLRLLTNNPGKAYQLSGFGLDIRERVPIQVMPTGHSLFYSRAEE